MTSPTPIQFSLKGDNLDINLNIYKDVQTDKYMCSTDCPCEDVESKATWTSLAADELSTTYGRIAPFVFVTPAEGVFTVKTYEECI